jgi:nitrate/nitrite transport system ATP-binding protein
MTYLKIENVDKHFDRGGQRSEVLKDVSLDIRQGEVISIIGHSGCGKSTLLNLIAGLTEVSSGGILWRGARSTAPGRSAPWCSRTIRCCPG